MKSLIFLAAIVLSAGTAFAADAPPPVCPLQEIASLDMTTETDGTVTVPVELNGKPFDLEVDTGSPYTSVEIETAEELNLPFAITGTSIFMNNIQANLMASLNSFTLGKIEISGGYVLATPNFLARWRQGLLGQDPMRAFDIEIDYYHSKLNIFGRNACTTNAAYWAHGPVAVVPFELDRGSHIILDATLDGKKLTAMIDTGSPSSSISLENAQDLFGIHDSDPRLKSFRQARINGGEEATISAFPFSVLDFEGVGISNPQIELIPKKNFGEDRVDMIIGANVLRRLRMYIAYAQNKIYLTDAEAK